MENVKANKFIIPEQGIIEVIENTIAPNIPKMKFFAQFWFRFDGLPKFKWQKNT